MRQSAKRLISLVAAILILLAAFMVYMELIRPAFAEVQKSRSESYSRRNFIETQTSIVSEVKKAIQNYNSESEARRLVSLALPNDNEQSNVVRQLTALAESRGLNVQTISASTPASQASKGKDAVRPLGVVNFNMKMTGNYSSFRAFVQDIETNMRVMDIKSASVEHLGKPNQDIYSFNLSVATYSQAN